MAKVYSLLAIGARSVVVMRQLLLVTQRWNHHDSIVHNGLQTNNHLESYNRKWNLLADKSSNIWAIQELFVKQEADARRTFLSNSAGQDCSNNTGRKEKSLDYRAKIMFILDSYDTMPKHDLITMLAHTIW